MVRDVKIREKRMDIERQIGLSSRSPPMHQFLAYGLANPPDHHNAGVCASSVSIYVLVVS